MAIPTIIYFIWGYFGFAGAWIPGKYDAEKKQYNVFWGLGQKLIFTEKGTFRFYLYTPFKRQGLIDTNGKVIIPFKYKRVFYDTYYSGRYLEYFLAENIDGKFGAINKENKIVIPFEYDKSPYPYPDNHYLKWQKGNKQGLSNKSKMILPAEYSGFTMPYDYADPFTIAEKNNFCYFVFPDGTKIKKNFFPYSYTSINEQTIILESIKSSDLDKNIWITEIDKIDTQEKKYNEQVLINKKISADIFYGIFNNVGNEILPLDYELIDYFHKDSLYKVKKDGLVGVFDLNTKNWKFPIKYQQLEYLNGYLPLTKIQRSATENEYWIDNNGVVILSGKTKVVEINLTKEYLIFSKNRKRYKLEFESESKKFIWYKL